MSLSPDMCDAFAAECDRLRGAAAALAASLPAERYYTSPAGARCQSAHLLAIGAVWYARDAAEMWRHAAGYLRRYLLSDAARCAHHARCARSRHDADILAAERDRAPALVRAEAHAAEAREWRRQFDARQIELIARRDRMLAQDARSGEEC